MGRLVPRCSPWTTDHLLFGALPSCPSPELVRRKKSDLSGTPPVSEILWLQMPLLLRVQCPVLPIAALKVTTHLPFFSSNHLRELLSVPLSLPFHQKLSNNLISKTSIFILFLIQTVTASQGETLSTWLPMRVC